MEDSQEEMDELDEEQSKSPWVIACTFSDSSDSMNNTESGVGA